MDYDTLPMTEIYKELSRLHDEFIENIHQDRNIGRIKQISEKIDRLLQALSHKTDSFSQRLYIDREDHSAPDK